MVEDDFFEVERLKALDDFRAKACTYLLYLNYKKKNRWRDRISPFDVLLWHTNRIDPGILNLPPPILENLYRHPQRQRRGYLVGKAVRSLSFSS